MGKYSKCAFKLGQARLRILSLLAALARTPCSAKGCRSLGCVANNDKGLDLGKVTSHPAMPFCRGRTTYTSVRRPRVYCRKASIPKGLRDASVAYWVTLYMIDEKAL